MMKKKRKYTRKKKISYISYLKKSSVLIFISLLSHIIFINFFIFTSDIKKSDVLVVLSDNKQNTNNIDEKLQKKIKKSIEIFQDEYAKKIYILGQKNKYNIDEIEIIKSYISKNDIWGGNIAYNYSLQSAFPKNLRNYLEKNEWDSIISVVNFSEYQKVKNNFSYILGKNNVSLQPIYSGFLDTIIGIGKNYFYWWKK